MTRSTDDPQPALTRRRLLTVGAVIPILPAAGAGDIHRDMPWQEGVSNHPTGVAGPATGQPPYVYFQPAEAAFVEAAVARLIPQDALGPGALEAGVPVFIDRQLSGDYGRGAHWYMQGPWAKGEPTQGWQSRMGPAAMYRAAIAGIDAAAQAEAGKAFAALAPEDRDAWLHRLEAGQLALPTVDAAAFFKLLWQNTLEGFWSDPLYGGNRDMAGWKLIGFPGARYDLSPYVGRHGQPFTQPPVGLQGRPAWHRA